MNKSEFDYNPDITPTADSAERFLKNIREGMILEEAKKTPILHSLKDKVYVIAGACISVGSLGGIAFCMSRLLNTADNPFGAFIEVACLSLSAGLGLSIITRRLDKSSACSTASLY